MPVATRALTVAVTAALAACGPVVLHGDSMLSHESIVRGGYELVFINNATDFNPNLGVRLIETFFAIYPPMVEQYNPAAATKVTFIIDPGYHGVADTNAGVVRFNPKWFEDHPRDLDVVTHEVMHIVQSYPPDSPGWITEGIADYVRYQLGVANPAAGWTLPEVTAAHHYTTSYRVTARFFVWLDGKLKAGVIKALDAAMRGRTYSPAFWAQETGKTIDELWALYVANPTL